MENFLIKRKMLTKLKILQVITSIFAILSILEKICFKLCRNTMMIKPKSTQGNSKNFVQKKTAKPLNISLTRKTTTRFKAFDPKETINKKLFLIAIVQKIMMSKIQLKTLEIFNLTRDLNAGICSLFTKRIRMNMIFCCKMMLILRVILSGIILVFRIQKRTRLFV